MLNALTMSTLRRRRRRVQTKPVSFFYFSKFIFHLARCDAEQAIAGGQPRPNAIAREIEILFLSFIIILLLSVSERVPCELFIACACLLCWEMRGDKRPAALCVNCICGKECVFADVEKRSSVKSETLALSHLRSNILILRNKTVEL